jgi:hypothetical protein
MDQAVISIGSAVVYRWRNLVSASVAKYHNPQLDWARME